MNADLPIQMLVFPKVTRKHKKVGSANFLLLIPDELKEKLKLFSKANYRSLTAEIVMRLEASVANESIDEHGVIVVHSPTPLK